MPSEDNKKEKDLSNHGSFDSHDSVKSMESADLVLPSPLWPNSLWRKAGNVSEPVIVTAIQAGFKMEAVNFLKNVKSFFSNTTVILFDMGLSKSDFDFVKQACDIYNGQEDNMTEGEERSYYEDRKSVV